MSANAALGKKIAELCCPAYAVGTDTGFFDTGSFFIFAGDSSAVRETIARATAACSSPPLVTTDLEYGAGRMVRDATQFPSLFAAGLAGPALAEEMGRIAAAEGRAVGFHWTLAPCVDPILDITNPTTSYRSAGRDPQTVIDIGRAYIRGLQSGGMLATAKHFPGDGPCRFDQHLTTAENPLSMDAWRATYGRIYAAMFAEGVAAVMPGHISLAAYDEPDPELGLCPPATLSPRLMKDLLRGELGFDGLIVSDAVNMGGFSGFMNHHDACARFLEAGGDVLLFARPTQKFIDEMLRRVDAGLLSEATLDDRLARFRRFRARALSGPPAGTGALREPASLAVAERIIGTGVQLLRDRQGWLPVERPETKRVLHLRIAADHTAMHGIVDGFETALRGVFASVEGLSDPGPDSLRRIMAGDDHDLAIVSVLNEYGYGVNHIHLAGPVARNMMGGWMKYGKPVVFISHAHPYLHGEYKASMDCVIRTCGTVDATIPRLIEIIASAGAPIIPDEVG